MRLPALLYVFLRSRTSRIIFVFVLVLVLFFVARLVRIEHELALFGAERVLGLERAVSPASGPPVSYGDVLGVGRVAAPRTTGSMGNVRTRAAPVVGGTKSDATMRSTPRGLSSDKARCNSNREVID